MNPLNIEDEDVWVFPTSQIGDRLYYEDENYDWVLDDPRLWNPEMGPARVIDLMHPYCWNLSLSTDIVDNHIWTWNYDGSPPMGRLPCGCAMYRVNPISPARFYAVYTIHYPYCEYMDWISDDTYITQYDRVDRQLEEDQEYYDHFFRNQSEEIENDEIPEKVGTSDIKYGKTVYEHLSKARVMDAVKATSTLTARIKKRAKRLTFQGFKNQSNKSYDMRDTHLTPAEISGIETIMAPIWKKYESFTMSDIGWTIYEYAMFFTNIWCTTNEYQLAVNLFGFAKIFKTSKFNFPPSITAAIGMLDKEKKVPLSGPTNQALSLSSILDKCRALRLTLQGIETIPFIKMLTRVMTVASLIRWMPKSIKCQSEWLEMAYSSWQDTIQKTYENPTSLLDLVLDTTSAAMDFVLCTMSDGMFASLQPHSFASNVSTALARGRAYRTGTLETSHGITRAQFMRDTEAVLRVAKEYASTKANLGMHTLALRNLTDLKVLYAELLNDKSNSDLRVAPLAIAFTGESGCGKSIIVHETINLAGHIGGFSTEDSDIHYVNTADAYDSGADSGKTVLVIDDMASEHPDISKYKGAVMIRYSNTIPQVTVQAEADKKGKIVFRHHFCAITSNVPDLNLQASMSFPQAGFNRCVLVEVSFNPKLERKKYYKNGKIDWEALKRDGIEKEAQVFRFYHYETTNSTARVLSSFKQIFHNEGKYLNKEQFFEEFTRLLLEKEKSGEEYLAAIAEVRKRKFCKKCVKYFDYCPCVETTVPKPVITELKSDVAQKILDDQAVGLNSIPIVSTECTSVENELWNIYDIDEWIRQTLYFWLAIDNWQERFWIAIMPGIWAGRDASIRIWLTSLWRFIQTQLIRLYASVSSRLAFALWFYPWVVSLTLFVVSYPLSHYQCTTPVFLGLYFDDDLCGVGGYLMQIITFLLFLSTVWMAVCALAIGTAIKSRAVDIFFNEISMERSTFAISMLLGTVGVSWLAFKSYYALFNTAISTVANQGNLSPTTMEEIESRNAEKNMWIDKAHFVHPEAEPTNHNATCDQIKKKISRNVVNVEIYDLEDKIKRVRTCGFYVCSDVLMINQHSLQNFITIKNVFVSIRRASEDVGGFIKKVAVEEFYNIPNTDITFITTSKGPTYTNMRSYFLAEHMKVDSFTPAMMLTRDKLGNMDERTFIWTSTDKAYNENRNQYHMGSFHRYDHPTHGGDCGSIAFSTSRPYGLLGIHTAADTRTNVGVTFAVTQDMISDAINAMSKSFRLRNESAFNIDRPELPTMLYDNPFPAYDTNLHFRDCVNFIPVSVSQEPMIDIYGSISNMRVSRKSEVRDTMLKEHLLIQGVPDEHGPPKFDTNRNHADGFQQSLEGIHALPADDIRWAIQDYTDELIAQMMLLNYSCQPLTPYEAINGIRGHRFVKALNMNTSSGMGLPSPKRKHFIETLYPDHVVYVPEDYLQKELDNIENLLCSNQVPASVFVSALKDEPTDIGKDKVRVFQVATVAMNIKIREYLLPILAFLYANPLLSESAVGINCTNDEWESLNNFLFDFHPDNVLEGDFSKYDLRQSGQTIMAGGTVFMKLAAALGYSPKDVEKVGLLMNSLSYKFMVWNGTLFATSNIMPSGSPITIALNTTTNCLLHRTGWVQICRELSIPLVPFREVAHLMCMGDDSIGTSKHPAFNMKNLQAFFVQYNMPYTDAHKSIVAKPFTTRLEARFCKRGFRSDERVGGVLAPLEIKSILKSLFHYMESKTPEEEIVIMNVDGAMREFSRHDRETFERYAHIVRTAAEAAKISHMTKLLYYSYEDWGLIHLKNYRIIDIGDNGLKPTGTGSDEDSESQAMATLNSSDDLWLRLCGSGRTERLIITNQSQNIQRQGSVLIFEINKINASNYNNNNNANDVNIIYKTSPKDSVMNLEFNSNSSGWGAGVNTFRDSTWNIASTSGGPQDFFQRPVKIFEYSWPINTTVFETVNPWEKYFGDPKVLERISHYKNLSADLKIKILLNGSSFHYGQLLVSYQPLHNNDEIFTYNALHGNMLINLSQMPSVYVNACQGRGGELTLPFFCPKNAVNIPSKEWENLGRLHIASVAPLAHVNGSLEPITVTIFAMAENVDVSTPTGCYVNYFENQCEFVNQSDEYVKPSALANNVAKAAGFLSQVPAISPFMLATQAAASATGQLLALFGMSKPRLVDKPVYVRYNIGMELAPTNVADPISVLALDAKKEINVDPRTVGLGPEDEMAITPIAMRESLLTTFNWNSSMTPETHLFSMRITPMAGNKGSTSEYHMTPSAFVTLPFCYWKGTMYVRFDFIGTPFHKGRVLFKWDPVTNLPENAGVYNTNYSAIMDINELTDKVFEIGWGQEIPFLPNGGLLTLPNFSSTEYTERSLNCNGVLSCYVVNELTCPSDELTEVTIRVSTWMGDDFEVAAPDSSAFEGTMIKLDPPPPITNSEPIVPKIPANPPPAPPPGINTNIDYTTSTPTTFIPLGANPAWPAGGTGRMEVPINGPFVPQVTTGTKLAFAIATGEPSGGNEEISLTISGPPAYTSSSMSVPINVLWLNGTADILEPPTCYRQASGDYLVSFRIGSPLTGPTYGVVNLTLPISGTWKLTSLIMGPAYGKFKYMGSTPAATTTATYAPITTGSFSGNTVDMTSGFVDFEIPPADRFFSTSSTAAVHALVTGENGKVYKANLIYSDGTLSTTSVRFSTIPPSAGMLAATSWAVLHNKPTLGIKGVRFTSDDASPGSLSFYSVGVNLGLNMTNQSSFSNQSGEVEEEGNNNAPLSDKIDVSMGNMLPGVEINSTHFGEKVTSIRQCVKRYVTTKRLTNASTIVETMSDVNYPGVGDISLVQLHPMDYFRAAYLAYRGSWRVKVLNRRSATATSVAVQQGSILFSRPSRQFMKTGNVNYLDWISWCGSSYGRISDQSNGVEVPYYSPLRFMPARRATGVDPANWQNDLLLGRDRSYINIVTRNPLAAQDYEILKAAGEDYSFFFFLTTPVVTLY
ncbi:hypothetical protein [Shahe picorna-like virus 7]|uniref:hypothetical protein n=1 Tax=Shahe picorna-like virus 7 TaxID=1923450 RepID=UPI0009094802|nr:hypothetical protein [Shahe picorna-like virus 7]APG77376.1 hypothetical protein [Shahe picorna-like virus 7]APG77396.1 hypothetical protein [Shahe picorna-like virus 7]